MSETAGAVVRRRRVRVKNRAAVTPAAPTPTCAPSEAGRALTQSFHKQARILAWCAHVAGRAVGAAKSAGASAMGALSGVFHWLVNFDDLVDINESFNDAVHTGASGGERSGALWDVFCATHAKPDASRYDAWLRLNGLPDQHNKADLRNMEQVALEIIDSERQPGRVVLQDFNVPLLHPFVHDADEIFAAYLEQMKKPGTYGCGTEARAIAEALGLRIAVYQPVTHADNTRTSELRATHGPEDAMYTLSVHHDGGAHWETVCRPDGVAPTAALSKQDRILPTRGDGNCLFHAIAKALEIAEHPEARTLTHTALRTCAVAHLRAHPELNSARVSTEVNDARAAMRPDRQDQADALAVQAVRRGQLHQPWDATWNYLASRLADVRSFTGGSDITMTTRAMDRLMGDVLRRMAQSKEAGALTPQIFSQRLNQIAAAHETSAVTLLSALSAHQRKEILSLFRDASEPVVSVEDARQTYGALFESLAFSDRLKVVGPNAFAQWVAHNLGDDDGRNAFVETLALEMDNTRHQISRMRAMPAAKWAALAAETQVQQAALQALIKLAQAPQVSQAKLRAMYRLVSAAPQAARTAWLSALLRDAPQTFTSLGLALNQCINGTTRRDVVDRTGNTAAIEAMFRCVGEAAVA